MSRLSPGDLAKIYPKASPRVIAKARASLDRHAQKFISLSPFCIIATSGADGTVDASPRGGHPGFVHIESPTELIMPDRAGNNRLDNVRNIVEGNGSAHLIFFIPGFDEVLRVAGRATVNADAELMARLVEFGKPPRAVIRISVSEVYFHCGKAAMRAKLWSADSRIERSSFPSIGEINYEQTAMGEPEKQAAIEAIYKEQL